MLDGEPLGENRELIVQSMEVIGRFFPPDGGAPEIFVVDDEHPASLVGELNSRIPEKDWRIGLTGEREAPWQICMRARFVDEKDGSLFELTGSSVGLRIACETLCGQVQTVCTIKGVSVLPAVTIGSTLMKTRFGKKSRPDFRVVRWIGLAVEQPLLKTVEPPTPAEIIGDQIPEHPVPKIDPTIGKVKAKKDPKLPAGARPFNDELPSDL
jgi:hypothetical protein